MGAFPKRHILREIIIFNLKIILGIIMCEFNNEFYAPTNQISHLEILGPYA